MKTALNPCFILHHRPYRETSMLLDVFSREHGKLTLVAKGAKRKNSRVRSLLQLHQRLNIAWSARSEMGTLTDVEPDGHYYQLTGSCLIAGFYLNELLVRLLHHKETCTELFDCYEQTLQRLAKQDDEQASLRQFEKQLLHSLGYGLVLDHDVITGKRIDEGQQYYYQFDHGPMLNPPQTSNCIKVSGKALIALERDEYSESSMLTEIKKIMQSSLSQHLGQKTLQSRELYRAYLKTIATD